MPDEKRIEEEVRTGREELLRLLEQLCAIPAPSNHEEKRAEFCCDWFRANASKKAYVDEALNAVCPVGVSDTGPVTVFMAHTDTVFPDTEPMPLKKEGDRWYCPGIGDDTANLAVLLFCARFAAQNGGKNMIFAADAGEEGLGNLKGCRNLMKEYGDRISEVISFDEYAGDVMVRAVGSERYRVKVLTEGGHSFADFGKPSAIHIMADMIHDLCRMPLPSRGHTTFNVGTVSGGTSVNSIAQCAEMLYEYRSDDSDDLRDMREAFKTIIANYRSEKCKVDVDNIGIRPCGAGVSETNQRKLAERVHWANTETYGVRARERSSSTDCNIPLSMGIPAVETGVCRGGGMHTREEFIYPDSLENGLKFALLLISSYL